MQDDLTPSAEMGWQWETTYVALPGFFYTPMSPTPVGYPNLVILNLSLAESLGLHPEAFQTPAGIGLLAGNDFPAGTTSIAQAYAGHQFGHFTMLGDGRAVLLGEHRTPNGRRVDVQLKGSGPTPYSRQGDGRAALGPMLREYLISEAMAALGIPTTRSLAVVSTGEHVYRETALAGAVLTRVADSHIRVGTFEYAARFGGPEAVRILADYTLDRHFPDLKAAENPYRALLEAVIQQQALRVAQWLQVGFIHGVMNTDNMALSGETLDYGPCAFMDVYHPRTVFSSIDRHGRYAYGNQRHIAQWNLARLAETLLPLLDTDPKRALIQAEGLMETASDTFETAWLNMMRRKLGLLTPHEDDRSLIASLLDWMRITGMDFTRTFRDLSKDSFSDASWAEDPEFQSWFTRWQTRLAMQQQPLEVAYQAMRAANPAVIPRNVHVEAVLKAATEEGDMAPMHAMLAALRSPYADRPEHAPYQDPGPATSEPYHTFCGT